MGGRADPLVGEPANPSPPDSSGGAIDHLLLPNFRTSAEEHVSMGLAGASANTHRDLSARSTYASLNLHARRAIQKPGDWLTAGWGVRVLRSGRPAGW
jgi:hypothetical protein